ncbi:MAG TPA: arginine--tRNA ligase [Patescibacteria group bacterium]
MNSELTVIKQKITTIFTEVLDELKWPKIGVEIVAASDPKFGDYTTNWSLQQSKNDSLSNYHSPQEIAKKLVEKLTEKIEEDGDHILEKAEIAGPGFVNFFVKNNVLVEEVVKIKNKEKDYFKNRTGNGKKARIEFVSANPTGPLHFGNARGGPIGDVLANVLAASGYEVLREYYHNDVGGQIEKLGQSLLNLLNGGKLEDQEYKGEYMLDLVKEIKPMSFWKNSTAYLVGSSAAQTILKWIMRDLLDLGIIFTHPPYNEHEMVVKYTPKVIKVLGKYLKFKDDALWFAPDDKFLKDRECVVVKSDKSYTYFANDIAYHDLKFKDNPDLVIDVLGANHSGHVPRLQAAVSALGYDVNKFKVILYQWVRFKKGEEILKMSKRAGTFITVEEVLKEVGKDATRFFLLMHDPNTPIDFDLDLAKKKSSDNPVFYVQYAHARISSILEKSKSQSLDFARDKRVKESKLTNQLYAKDYTLNLFERNLALKLIHLPEIIEEISKTFAVQRLATYSIEVADLFHKFYENCRVIDEPDERVAKFRLELVNATGNTLKSTLKLLGIEAPVKM